MFSKSILAAILLSCQLVSSANGAAVDTRGALDIFSPKILEPTAATVWTIGNVETVLWDTSNAPVNISNGSGVYLRGYGFIVQGFDLRAGHVDLTVPDVTPGQYQIALFGDSGNVSPFFTIQA